MAEKDENENSRKKSSEEHVCHCNRNCRLRSAGNLERNEASDESSGNENSVTRCYSDSDDSVFTHDDSEDETVHRRSQTLTFRRKKNSDKSKDLGKKRKRFWTFRIKKRLPVRLKKRKDHGLPEPNQVTDTGSCVCTGYRRTEDHVLGAGVVFNVQSSHRYVNGVGGTRSAPLRSCSESSTQVSGCCLPGARIMGAAASPSVPEFDLMQIVPPPPLRALPEPLDFVNFNPMDYPTEDIDEILIAQRARDMEMGIEIEPNNGNLPTLSHNRSVSPSRASAAAVHAHYHPHRASHWGARQQASVQVSQSAIQQTHQLINLNSAFKNQCVIATAYPATTSVSEDSETPNEYTALAPHGTYVPGRTVHTQVDYIHCLVPDLLQITNCSFYWGVMDRYEAEKLLENRPEGTFLLRDSAQEEFLFSVSFRRYGRSLHARIEQWKHKFSFDSHDPGVFASQTVCGLIEHYKDPSCCMFFEPMLTLPLNRTFPFSLQHLCRAVICSSTTYDGVNFLPLPKPLRQYLKYYHYKQKVRVRKFEHVT